MLLSASPLSAAPLSSQTTQLDNTIALTKVSSTVQAGSISYERTVSITGVSGTVNVGNVGFTKSGSLALTGNLATTSMGVLTQSWGNTTKAISGNTCVARANLAAFTLVKYSDSVQADNSVYTAPLVPKKRQVVTGPSGTQFTIDPEIGLIIATQDEITPAKTYTVVLPHKLASISSITTNTNAKVGVSFSGNSFDVTFYPKNYYEFTNSYVDAKNNVTVIPNSYIPPVGTDLYKYTKAPDRMFMVFTVTGIEYDEYDVQQPMYRKFSIDIEPDYTTGRDAIQNIIKMRA